ncbi:MAG: histidine--tRNA ligase [Flammeovirgaceae bacterium]
MGQKLGNLKGTRDFDPAQMVKRYYIIDTIKGSFQKYGFQPLETPAMESLEVLTGKYGDEGDKLLFKILNSGDYLSKTSVQDYEAGYKQMLSKVSKKGLRYDLTVPFARYVVMNQSKLTFPFKRYQIQPVWRADRPQKGRYQEFYQCDADVVGTDSLICEAEIVAMMNEVLGKLGIKGASISLNNRKVLVGIAQAIGEEGKESDLCVAIDKLDKIGKEKVEEELTNRGFSNTAIEELQPLFSINGSNAEKVAQLKKWLVDSKTGMEGVEELEELFDIMQKANISDELVNLDITLARGLSYYTGAIFEVKVAGSKIGSISGGGRYDDLTGVFGLKGVSGVGFSFGIDRLYDVLEEQDLFPKQHQDSTKVLFINFDKASQDYCLPLLQQLRSQGINSEIYPHVTKLGKQMTYANNKGIPYVIMAGSNEMESGLLTLKNMESGEQEKLRIEEIIEKVHPKP